jgi:hypothetical protein
MSKDDNSGDSQAINWEHVRHQGKRAVAWTLGTLLKLGGVLAIIAGLMTIALANMDGDPREGVISGTVITFVGLLMVYFGIKISKKAKRP